MKKQEALEAPTLVLREVFGPALELGPMQVRLAGVPPHEPIMHVCVNAPLAHIEPVRRVLLRRRVEILEASDGRTRCVLRGEAPLARLLGLSAELKQVTLGSALLWTALTRYALRLPDPDPAAA
jgi:hypothetical protein